jgi:hypothetical protein
MSSTTPGAICLALMFAPSRGACRPAAGRYA